MCKIIFITLLLSFVNIYAQHDHEEMNHNMQDTIKTDSMKNHEGMNHSIQDTTKMDSIENHEEMNHDMQDTMKMNSVKNHKMNLHNMNHTMSMNGGILLTDAMSKEGSGTSWLPVSSPMYMSMFHSNKWMFMLHGSIVSRYTHQGGLRGKDGFSAPNWFMISAQKKLSMNSQIMFRTMLSLDRLTDGGDGYALLFQTGETWNGKHLVDQQHPHDLISELALSLSAKFSKSISSYIYLGYPGEPTVGPPAFMHRPSVLSNPDAPISHHWQDATHITFGVATMGLSFRNFKVEGSVFNGTEPDENRFNFDKPKFNSYSGRISYNPSNNFALQTSAGFIKDPEGEGLDVIRRSASILYSKIFNSISNLSASLIWGQNKDDFAGAQNSYIIEAEYYLFKNSVYTRLEWVQKTRRELDIEIDESQKELIGVYTLGYKRKLFSFAGIDFNTGLQASLYSIPTDIRTYYGNGPVSYQFYISLLPKH